MRSPETRAAGPGAPPASDRPRRSPRRRRLALTAIAVTLVLIGFAVITARLFLWPRGSEFVTVDAVVVLSGDAGDRMKGALQLMERDAARVLVHAGEPDSDFARRLCREKSTDYEVVCVAPRPDSTAAEAKAVGVLGRERRWSSIAVVTSEFHATRANITFRRCFDGEVEIVPTRPRLGRRHHLRQVPGEWLRLAYLQVVDRTC